MLATNLQVIHYPGMPGQSNSNSGGVSGSNNNVNVNDNTNSNSGVLNANNSPCNVVSSGITTVATKNQLEQLNTMREALFSQDGWGCQHVNQDTNWEVPSSPEPTIKDPSAPSLWKPNVNNGTELWESTLRNGGQPPNQSTQKTPWGHTPSSNLGGTWGEDDDGAETNSVWSGAATNPVTNVVNVAGLNGSNPGSSGSNTSTQWDQRGTGIIGASATASSGAAMPNITSGNSNNITGPNVMPTSVPPAGSTWGDHRDMRTNTVNSTVDLRSAELRDQIRSSPAGDPRDIRLIDPRDPIRGDPRGISGRLNGASEMWGQHHAIAQNHLTTLNKIVGQGGSSSTVAQNTGAGTIVPGVGGINAANNVAVTPQWGNSQPVVISKDNSNISSKNISGWEDSSPPTQRRNLTNYDDGTSVWGQQHRSSNSGAPWKDVPENLNRSHLLRNSMASQNSQNVALTPVLPLGNNGGGGNMGNTQSSALSGVCASVNNSLSTVGPQNRIGPVPSGPHKQEVGGLWVQSNNPSITCRNNGSWEDGTHNVGNSTNWVDEKANSSVSQMGSNLGPWNDGSTWSKSGSKMTGSIPGWGHGSGTDVGDVNDWNSHGTIANKPPPKIQNAAITGMNSDVVKQSKQYRYLVESGFKKEDVERALITTNMNMDEATEILRSNPFDGWRRHDESVNSFMDHNNSTNSVGFPGRFGGASLQTGIAYPQGNILNNMSSGSISSAPHNITALNTLQVQKFLNHNPHNMASVQTSSINNSGTSFVQGTGSNLQTGPINIASNGNNQPSTQQLRMLVQQIQMAVHSGYLSSQILNQPLSPATLVLLNQLLSSIKHLQAAQQTLARANGSNNIQINVAISKHKQQIQSLQNQINAQQALYIKQQHNLQQQPTQSQTTGPHLPNSNSEFLRAPNESVNTLQSNFADMSLNKTANNFQGSSSQQSRLNQWKLPSLDKEENSEFSRAPGTTKQNLPGNASGSIGHLGLHNDNSTWSSSRNIGDGWGDVANDTENKDWAVAPSAAATSYSDLVQEFEPGKPWKGSQIKSVEDDPSMTPGSVVRSPLSINPTAKDSDIFTTTSKISPTDITPLSLGSSTWSFNPPSANPNFPSWSDSSQQCSTSDLWANQMNKSSRGPPPGLVSKGPAISTPVPSTVSTSSTNNWIVGGNRGWSGSSNPNWNSSWLLLKNLNTQIDGSTLRTLCMQHGHPVSFHLYLNQGFALCKYATHEEANKAQMTLNNCVLSNTTICAESPSENEVQNLIKHIPQNTSGLPASITTVTNCNSTASNLVAANSPNSVIVSSSSSNTAGVNTSNSSSNVSTLSNNSNTQSMLTTSSSGAPINSNSSNTSSNHNNWRQSSQNSGQNLSRSTGREADYEFDYKFVCSIVDD